ncbi:hypothetical protein ACFY6U_40080 [Streptomyces sp. NPDC013157]|uniref:hypothetical protein n=1 Tax=Streptomyces sp. NPDC013157 TaxID=3364861 RepID=UPI0036AE24E3
MDEKVHRFVALAREVRRAAEAVVLEGPHSTAEAAGRVARASGDLSAVTRRMVKNAHAGGSSRKEADTALATARERALHEAVKDFRTAAGDILGNTG